MSLSLENFAIKYPVAKQLSSGTCKEYRGTVEKWLARERGPDVDRISRTDIRDFLDCIHEKAAVEGGSNAWPHGQ